MKQQATANTTRQRRSGTLGLNSTQVGLVLGFVGIGLILAFGAGFIVGMWYHTSEHAPPSYTELPAGAGEQQAEPQELTFYSALTGKDTAVTPPSAAPPGKDKPTPRLQDTPSTPNARPAPPPSPRSDERVTALDSRPPPPRDGPGATVKTLPQATRSGYSVQVGSFRYRDEAEVLHHHLTQRGYPVQISPAAIPGKGIVYRVQVGNFPDRASADRTVQRLATQERVSGIVVEESR